MLIVLFVFGFILIAWGFYRIKSDFSENKKRNNILSLLLQGGPSGIGQFLSGIICIIIGIMSLFIK
nr:hypothetical protein [Bacillus cereus]